jgi:hypothetical protein
VRADGHDLPGRQRPAPQVPTKGSDRFDTIVPALALLVGVLLTQFIEWRRRVSEANREDRRFIEQRWWERRAEAYSEIMMSLARMKAFADAEVARYGTEREATDDQIKRWRQSRAVLDDATGQGMFMISDAALECLNELDGKLTTNSALGQKGDYQGELLGDMDAIRAAIPKLAAIARADLGAGRTPGARGETNGPR